MIISLVNKSGRCLVFTLPHETFCRALGVCRCAVEPGRRALRIATSLTLASGAKVSVEDAVLEVPDVVHALHRNELVVQPEAASSPSAPSQREEALEKTRPDTPKAKRKRGGL